MAANAKDKLKAARRALDELAERDRRTGNREVTDEYLEANRRVIDAEAGVPWWRR